MVNILYIYIPYIFIDKKIDHSRFLVFRKKRKHSAGSGLKLAAGAVIYHQFSARQIFTTITVFSRLLSTTNVQQAYQLCSTQHVQVSPGTQKVPLFTARAQQVQIFATSAQ
jgi:hypothetical protein